MIPESLQTLVATHQQQHLLRFWDRLSSAEQSVLTREIEAVDFAQLGQLLAKAQAAVDWNEIAARATSPDAFRLGAVPATELAAARAAGEAALKAGQVAVVLVAGGQGTRLGFDHPKGMYSLGPVSGHSLFQILLEKVLAVSRRYQQPVPLVVMTSPATHEETAGYLREHDWFGLPADDVRMCCQGTMPAVDMQSGQILLAEPGRLALSPDGHGGLVAAMASSGTLDELQRRGISLLFYMQVDNPLATVCDPVFLGHHLRTGSQMSTQVVAKRDPLDRVGNFARYAGKARIIEYSDLPDEAAKRRHVDGSLVFWAGNIAVHAFDIAFLKEMAGSADGLPFHRAEKKVPYVDASGHTVDPDQPNAYKFERFIFDLLPAANRAIAVEVDEAECFAPVKNEPGAAKDTPESAQRMMVDLHTAWLQTAGVEVLPGVAVEISPLLALDAEELAQKVTARATISSPKYLREG
ncbi:MAG: UTP--glucose-1-phosphate uridylyltransferase [Pirellulales bacterium]